MSSHLLAPRLRWVFQMALPWPSPKLSPNTRLYWARKAGEAKRYRAQVAGLVREMPHPGIPPVGPLLLDLTFHPPDGRRRDLDNMLAAIKSGLDGLAMGTEDGLLPGLGLDDSRFVEHTLRIAHSLSRGAVLARIAVIDAAGGLLD